MKKSLELNVTKILNGTARRASHATRYSSRPVLRRESVAEHSWHTSYYSFVIATHLNSQGLKPDFGLLMRRAVLHDLEESELGDLQRGIKHGNPVLEKVIEEMGERAILKIERESGLPELSIMKFWKRSKHHDLEGHIVRVADVLSVVSYMVEEHLMGNRILSSMLGQEVLEYLQSVLILMQEHKQEILERIMWDVVAHFKSSLGMEDPS